MSLHPSNVFGFFLCSTFVGSAWSFVFFIPATTANDLRLQYQILSITLFSYLNSWERVGGILSFWENLVTWLLRHQMKNKWGLLTYSKTFLSFSFMTGRSFFDVVGNFGPKKITPNCNALAKSIMSYLWVS